MPFNSGSGGFWCISFVFDYNFVGLLFYPLFQVILNGSGSVNKAVVDKLYLQFALETFLMSVCNSRIDQAKLRLQELYHIVAPNVDWTCRGRS